MWVSLCSCEHNFLKRVIHSLVKLERREVKRAPLTFLSPEDCVFIIKDVRINQKHSLMLGSGGMQIIVRFYHFYFRTLFFL